MRKLFGCVAALSLLSGVAAAQAQDSREMLRSFNLQVEQSKSATRAGAVRGVAINDGGSGPSTGDVQVESRVSERPRDDAPRVTPAAVGAAVPQVPRDIQVNLRVTFETGSAYIRPSSAQLLSELCEAIRLSPEDRRFFIIGHADASGDFDSNLRLSQARAEEVARHLERECGVEAARLKPVGLGESRLLDGVPPISEDNRRVEIAVDST